MHNTSKRPAENLQGSFQACTHQLTTTSVQEKEAVDRSSQAEEPLLAGEGKGEGAVGSEDGEGSGATGRQMPHEVWHWVRV